MKNPFHKLTVCTAVAGCALAASSACAQQAAAGGDDTAELAKKLSNPIAALISLPVKINWDTGIGAADANRTTVLVQPVIPFDFNNEWNLISRTIVPIISAQSPVVGGNTESGVGDVLQSLFFSPKAPTSSGWIWGAGPVLLLPTASNNALGGEKWGLGPTAVFLKQDSGWTYGLLANHVWSVGGNNNRADFSNTFVQPFVSFTTKSYTTFGMNTESTYDWKNNQWTVPINLTVGQLVKFGSQPVSFTAGYRNYVETAAGGPNWGLSFTVTWLFPK